MMRHSNIVAAFSERVLSDTAREIMADCARPLARMLIVPVRALIINEHVAVLRVVKEAGHLPSSRMGTPNSL